ncbi:MAG: cobalamin-dependent protein, partial [Clostridiales bacterium]|nr:cobalamin-dependent protein [Clostridiales bacterium]
MNIALIVTLGGDLVRSTEHVGIGYLSAYLRKHNHTVKVLEIKEPDIQREDQYIPELSDCKLIGFTTTCVTMKNVACLVDVVKRHLPDSHIACGGHMATFSGKELLEKYPNIDFAIQGEGEITFADLVEALETKKDLSNILGIVYRSGNKVVENKSRPLIDDLD